MRCHWILSFSFVLFCSVASSTPPLRFRKPAAASHRRTAAPDRYYEVTRPVPANGSAVPSCSLALLRHDFAYTYGLPPVQADYAPPADCPGRWDAVALEVNASCRGEQYDRIAAVWIDGVEILRTSTAEPTEDGIFWSVRKDVTRYVPVLRRSNASLSVMLENIVDEVFTGVYHVNISMYFYGGKNESEGDPDPKIKAYGDANLGGRRKLESFDEKKNEKTGNWWRKFGFRSRDEGDGNGKLGFRFPGDMIVPISSNGEDGFWFRIRGPSDIHSKSVEIPLNTYRATLEIFVSFHSNDEFWYSNPPDAYIQQNNLTTRRGNGSFRQVFATIDGNFAGSVVPFPVVFTGGINPLFWEPVVGIGAFDLPSYNIDLTPLLGLLLDGKPHSIGLGVTDAIEYWLVDANLHLHLDHALSKVDAKVAQYRAPALSVAREYKFSGLDGSFKIKAKRKVEFSGWTNCSLGNLTSTVFQEFDFKNSVKFKDNGTFKDVKQKVKAKTKILVEAYPGQLLAQAVLKTKYPLHLITSTLPEVNNTYLMTTNFNNGLDEEFTLSYPSQVHAKANCDSLHSSQLADGWMLVQDHSVLKGSATTRQKYQYRDATSCYSANVVAADGKLVDENYTDVCTDAPL